MTLNHKFLLDFFTFYAYYPNSSTLLSARNSLFVPFLHTLKKGEVKLCKGIQICVLRWLVFLSRGLCASSLPKQLTIRGGREYLLRPTYLLRLHLLFCQPSPCLFFPDKNDSDKSGLSHKNCLFVRNDDEELRTLHLTEFVVVALSKSLR